VVMECFDISNISTTHVVASMVSFRNGVPDRANYRRYRIKTVEGQNDFASMAEVVRRRYSRVLLETAERTRAESGGRRAEEGEDVQSGISALRPPSSALASVDYSPEFSQENVLDT
jgi:excinuclease UvrABC nuclease subunit